MTSRRQKVFADLHEADKDFVEAAGYFTRQMEVALADPRPRPDEPWSIAIAAYIAMQEAKLKRKQAYAAFGAVVMNNESTEDA